MSYYQFKCGCKIPIINGIPKIDYDNLNLDCHKVWDIFQSGKTHSVFQLEAYLGKHYSKQLSPESIKDVAALVAIIRPSMLNAVDEENKKLTDVFCDLKNKRKPIDHDNPLTKLLPETFGMYCFQEQIMLVSMKIAGFTGSESFKLIKTIAKKDAEKLFEFENKFIEGCIKIGIVNKDQAAFIFEQIKSAARYSFNLSHSVCYAMTAYQTAWVKAHLPYHYLCAWLRSTKDSSEPLEEIRGLVSEGRRLDIPVLPPSIKNIPQVDFFINNKAIYFGINSIKNCGVKSIQKLIDNNIDTKSCSWNKFLILYSEFCNVKQLTSMIRVGCFDYTLKSRMSCEFELSQWGQLTATEKRKVKEFYKNNTTDSDILVILKELLASNAISSKRIPIVQSIVNSLISPPISLEDSVNNIVDHEKNLLGINISCTKTQIGSIPQNVIKCKNVSDEGTYRGFVVGEISGYREFKPKTGKIAGQTMATFNLSDESGECSCVAFPTEAAKHQSSLYDGNIILIEGKRSNRGGFVCEKIYEV